MGKDETELIARILSGNHDDYRCIVDHYKDVVFRHCFYITHDEDTAEDIAQETFIKGYEQLHSYDAMKGSLKTWLFTIATRKCLDQLRKTKTLPLYNEDLHISSLKTPEQSASDNELRRAVKNLAPKYRTVVILYYWEGCGYKEIATNMGVPIGSVRAWLHRAKKQLKEDLS